MAITYHAGRAAHITTTHVQQPSSSASRNPESRAGYDSRFLRNTPPFMIALKCAP